MTPKPITLSQAMKDGEQRAAFRHALDEMGVSLASSSFERAFARTKSAADRDGQVSAPRVQAIVDEVVSGMETFQEVTDTFR
ncbi:MAG TPA: hypothetical protein VG872_01375 [Acidimicrobiia bacterium]|jgi:isopropylmalate/homocitrate/citramalate synthase|nr:hypothetical protein [Acidimicrobiia bacterium]